MSRTTNELLEEAVAHFQLAMEHARGTLSEQLVIDAIAMRISAGIDVLGRLDPDVRAELFGDEWRLMWGMRNRIAHGYLLVDGEIIGATIRSDIPQILSKINQKIATA